MHALLHLLGGVRCVSRAKAGPAQKNEMLKRTDISMHTQKQGMSEYLNGHMKAHTPVLLRKEDERWDLMHSLGCRVSFCTALETLSDECTLQLIEVNAHSLFSKWFSESGKLVNKLFASIQELVDDPNCFVVVLIDEVSSERNVLERTLME